MLRTLLAAIAACLLVASAAHAQRRAPAHLVLARVCVHEAGWESPADCAAIWDVLTSGAERHGISRRSFAHAYSGRALRGRTSRPWVAELNERGDAPRSWPRVWVARDGRVMEHPGWGVFRARWLALLEECRRIVAGEVASSCVEPPHDWGGPVDDERARRLGLVRVSCGETRNRFYLRPSLLADRD
jgi:hypothetical protein